MEPLWKGQECLTKVAKFGPFLCTILHKSCLFYPSWQATSFERSPAWVAFIEGFHCILFFCWIIKKILWWSSWNLPSKALLLILAKKIFSGNFQIRMHLLNNSFRPGSIDVGQCCFRSWLVTWWHKDITLTSADVLSINSEENIERNFIWNSNIFIQEKHFKMSSAKWGPFYHSQNVICLSSQVPVTSVSLEKCVSSHFASLLS